MSEAAKVAWFKPDEVMHRQSWKDGRPAERATPVVDPAADVDTHSTERAGLIERLCVLAGVTAWREPVQGFSTFRDSVPREHILAAALAYARNHSGKSRDVGPDILEALVLQRMTDHVPNIETKLVFALRDVSRRMTEIDPRVLRASVFRVIQACVSGLPSEPAPRVTLRDWAFIETFGTRALWSSAERTLAEVKRTLRMPTA